MILVIEKVNRSKIRMILTAMPGVCVIVARDSVDGEDNTEDSQTCPHDDHTTASDATTGTDTTTKDDDQI